MTMLIDAVILCEYVLEFLIFARVVLSWFPVNRNNPIVNFIYMLTEPMLGPIRRLIQKSPVGGGLPIDFSPIIAFFLMRIMTSVILSLLVKIIA